MKVQNGTSKTLSLYTSGLYSEVVVSSGLTVSEIKKKSFENKNITLKGKGVECVSVSEKCLKSVTYYLNGHL
jgi:hypothetical protein